MTQLWEENRALKSHLHRLLTAHPPTREEELVFATPNGSADAGDHEVEGEEQGEGEETTQKPPQESAKKTGKGGTTKKKKKEEEEEEEVGSSAQQQTMAVVLKLMEGMQELHKKVRSHKDMQLKPSLFDHRSNSPAAGVER